MYQSNLSSQCMISGNAILENGGYGSAHVGIWIGITLSLALAMRFMSWA